MSRQDPDFIFPIPLRSLEDFPLGNDLNIRSARLADENVEIGTIKERVPLTTGEPVMCMTFMYRSPRHAGGAWLVMGSIPLSLLRYVKTPAFEPGVDYPCPECGALGVWREDHFIGCLSSLSIARQPLPRDVVCNCSGADLYGQHPEYCATSIARARASLAESTSELPPPPAEPTR